jgi:hypothetical protein
MYKDEFVHQLQICSPKKDESVTIAFWLVFNCIQLAFSFGFHYVTFSFVQILHPS